MNIKMITFKILNKIVSIVLSMLLFAALFPCIDNAQAPQSRVFVQSPEVVEGGKTFELFIKVQDVSQLTAWQFNLSYSPEVIQVDSVQGGDAVSSGIYMSSVLPVDIWTSVPPDYGANPNSGEIKVLGHLENLGTVSISDGNSGTLAAIRFSVPGNPGDLTQITLSEVYLYNDLGEKIEPLTVIGADLEVLGLPVIETEKLPEATLGKIYTTSLQASGGAPPYSWTITGLPQGLNSNENGEIYGTPGTEGDFSVEVYLNDAGSPVGSDFEIFLLHIFPALQFTTVDIPEGETGKEYFADLRASGGAGTLFWSAEGLPLGLAIDGSGDIEGYPQQSGTFEVIITVTDSFIPPNSESREFLLRIYGPLTISTQSLPFGLKGQYYDTILEATGGLPPYHWSSENFPEDITLAASGQITGFPENTGQFSTDVTVKDSRINPEETSTSFILNIYPKLELDSLWLPDGRKGKQYNFQLSASGGKAPYIWYIEGLPESLSFTESGFISGLPDEFGLFDIDVRVTDSLDPANSADAVLSLHIYQIEDVNKDDAVGVGDILKIELMLMRTIPKGEDGDTNMDGRIDVGDIARV